MLETAAPTVLEELWPCGSIICNSPHGPELSGSQMFYLWNFMEYKVFPSLLSKMALLKRGKKKRTALADCHSQNLRVCLGYYFRHISQYSEN